MATPHIKANKEDISKIVLMSGDPQRAKFIAEKYLDNYKCINDIRNMYGYTGFYKGKKISVMSHGMGIPSMGIYSYELFNFYDVDIIIRIGTAGSYSEDIEVLDTLLVDSCYSESTYGKIFCGKEDNIIEADKEINNIILDVANSKEINLKLGRVHSTDVFYTNKDIYKEMKDKYNCMAVEMETFSLFVNAKKFKKKATCILTISDSLITKREISAEDRVIASTKAIEIALDSTLKI